MINKTDYPLIWAGIIVMGLAWVPAMFSLFLEYIGIDPPWNFVPILILGTLTTLVGYITLFIGTIKLLINYKYK